MFSCIFFTCSSVCSSASCIYIYYFILECPIFIRLGVSNIYLGVSNIYSSWSVQYLFVLECPIFILSWSVDLVKNRGSISSNAGQFAISLSNNIQMSVLYIFHINQLSTSGLSLKAGSNVSLNDLSV